MAKHRASSPERNSVLRRKSTVFLEAVGSIVLAAGLSAGSVAGAGSQGANNEKSFFLTSVCDPQGDWVQESIKQNAADACLEARSGRVALVSFGLAPEITAQIAAESHDVAFDASDGLMDLHFEPIIASPEAQHTLDEQSPNCADGEELSSFASHIAADTMHLDGYVEVVALSNKPSCDNTIAGRTFSVGSKYIDVYKNASNPKLDNQKDRHFEELVISHELGHGLLNYGHVGGLNMSDTETIPKERWYIEHETRTADVTSINLDMLLEVCRYNQYALGPNIMGDANEQSVYLNAMQKHMAQWPERAKGIDSTKMATLRPGNSVELMKPSFTDREFVVTSLSKTYSFTESETGKKSPNYTKFVVDPYLTDRGAEPNILNLYLASSDQESSLNIGEFYLEDEKTYKLYIDDKIIVTSTHEGKFNVSVVSRNFKDDPFAREYAQPSSTGSIPR